MNSGKRSRMESVLVLLVIILFAAAILFAFTLSLEADEAEHLHNAYLISQGLTPYKGFYEHHLPFGWYLLSIPYCLGASVSAGIILGRTMALLFIGVTFLILYAIRRLGRNSMTALAAFALIQLLPLREGNMYFVIRPEVLSLPVFAASIYFLLKARMADDKYIKMKSYVLLVICLSLLCGFSPRAFFYILGAIVFVLADYRRLGFKNICLLGGIFAVVPGALIAFFGFDNIIGYVLMVSANDVDSFNWFTKAYYWPHLFFVLCSVTASICLLFWKQAGRPCKIISILNLLCLVTPFIEGHPYTHTLTYGFLTSSLVLGYSVLYLNAGFGKRLGRLLFAGFLLWVCGTALRYSFSGFWDDAHWRFKDQMDYRNAVSDLIKQETVFCIPKEHPLGVPDAAYFGYAPDHSRVIGGIPLLRGKIPYIEALEKDVIRRKPVLVSKKYLKSIDAKLEINMAGQYLKAPWNDDLLIRRDYFDEIVALRKEKLGLK